MSKRRTLGDIEGEVGRFLKERGWNKLRPADVAKSIIIEGAELLELFQWENLSREKVKNNPKKVAEIREEIADILIYCIEMAALLRIDTERAVIEKLAHNAKKYPAVLVRKSEKEHGSGKDLVYWRIKREYRKENRVK